MELDEKNNGTKVFTASQTQRQNALQRSKNIVKYSNRKLYDLELGRYVTIDYVGEKILQDKTVRVIFKPAYSDVRTDVTAEILNRYLRTRIQVTNQSEQDILNLISQVG